MLRLGSPSKGDRKGGGVGRREKGEGQCCPQDQAFTPKGVLEQGGKNDRIHERGEISRRTPCGKKRAWARRGPRNKEGVN